MNNTLSFSIYPISLWLCNVFILLPILTYSQEDVNLVLFESTGIANPQLLVTNSSEEIFVAGTFTKELKVGSEVVYAEGEEDVFIAKFSPSGSLTWLLSFGGSFEDVINDMDIDNNGNILLVGRYRNKVQIGDTILTSSTGGDAAFFVKLSSSGSYQAINQYDNSSLVEVTQLAIDNQNHIYLAGFFRDSFPVTDTVLIAKGRLDLFCLKMDNTHHIDWLYRAGISGNTLLTALTLTPDDQLVIGGTFDGFVQFIDQPFEAKTFDKDVFITKLNQTGNVEWSLAAGGVFEEELLALTTDSIGNIYGGGNLIGVMKLSENITIQSTNGLPDFYWFQLSGEGKPERAFTFGSVGNEQISSIQYLQNQLYLGFQYDKTWDFQGTRFPANGNLSSGLIALSILTNELQQSRRYSTEQDIFLNQFLIDDRKSIFLGSFTGKSIIAKQEIDAGNHFWGWLEIQNEILTNTQTRDFTQSALLSTYPNPTYDILYFKAPEPLSWARIYDSQGRLVLKINIKGKEKINTASLSAGTYLLSVAGKKHKYVKQFIKK